MHPKSSRSDLSEDNVPEIFRLRPFKSLNLYEVTVEELQQYMSNGDMTSVEYVTYNLERVHAVNPYLEAVIELNPDASAIAAELDNERRAGRVRGMLHGIPILVKDNMATHDKMQTTAGSWALLGSKVPKDAHVVSRLHRAGAIILGHTNMSEWASVRSTQASTGYSPRGGQTRNPFDLSKTPCTSFKAAEVGYNHLTHRMQVGSSSGSAVAVSANMVPISLGTETDTSIIGPANYNGVVGIKPTVGLTSRAGIIPISENLDTVGSFGRTVADAVHGLSAIVGPDEDDPMTLVSSRIYEKDYSKFLASRTALKGARFGLPWIRCWDSVAQAEKHVALQIFEAIENAGGKIIRTEFPCAEDRIPPDGSWDWKGGEPSKSEFTVVRVDAYNGINTYLSGLSASPVKTIEDVLAFDESNTGTEGAKPGHLPAFASGQDNLQEIVDCGGVKDETYSRALEHIQHQCRNQGIDAALRSGADDDGRAEFDALLLCDRKGAGQQLAAQAGYPIISIPIGLDAAGFPVSLSLQHTAWQEGTLVKWASAIEDLVHHVQGWRPTPEYRSYHSKNIPIDPPP